jgi:hypothetical protein
MRWATTPRPGAATDHLLRSVGEDPEQCLVEGIPVGDSVVGRVERDLERA